jgi:hypothetical protein
LTLAPRIWKFDSFLIISQAGSMALRAPAVNMQPDRYLNQVVLTVSIGHPAEARRWSPSLGDRSIQQRQKAR